MNMIALFILYNHHYTKNIDRVEQLYKGKFSYIYHLIPFYNGQRENVITVYESSYQFQSYIAQAYQHVKKQGFTHFFVVADDMIINPQIDENNLFEFVGIAPESAFITDIRDLSNYFYDIPIYHSIRQRGIEVMDILPPKDIAISRMRRAGLDIMPNVARTLKYFAFHLLKMHKWQCRNALSYLLYRNKPFAYPSVWAYSDILILPQDGMKDFVRYCGAFAGLNYFVENAIPSALYLSYDRVTLGCQIKLRYISQLYNLGEKGEKEFLSQYNYVLDNLRENYPKDMFFIHPIKLSKWK